MALTSRAGAEARSLRPPTEVALLVALLVLTAGAWVVTHALGDEETRLGILTGGQAVHAHGGGHAHHQAAAAVDGVGRAGAEPVAAGLFLLMWLVMVAAMMLPTVLPVVLTFDRWTRREGKPRTLTASFLSGYLTVWCLCGVAAYGLLLALQAWLPADHDGVIRIGAVLLAAAGAYQFTNLKKACLTSCRSPLAVVAEHLDDLRRGHRGPFKVGVGHGLYCVGCCWTLMLVLVLLGMMSVTWMGILAAVMLAEKVAPCGVTLSRATGVALLAAGAWLVAFPATLPGLS